jgi:hypothetical protein
LIYNIDIHVTSGHIFSGKYGHTCTIGSLSKSPLGQPLVPRKE